jgi:hypothetical protein
MLFRPLSGPRHLFARRLDGVDDVRVTGASTQVALNAVRDLLACGLWISLKQLDPGQNHPRSAIAALETVTLPESLLDGMQFAVASQPFDGGDCSAVRLHRENGAGFHRLAIKQDRASTAKSCLASNVGAGEFAVVAKKMRQKSSGFDRVLLLNPIDLDFNRSVHGIDSIQFFLPGYDPNLLSVVQFMQWQSSTGGRHFNPRTPGGRRRYRVRSAP